MDQADERQGEGCSMQHLTTGMLLENQLLICVARRSVDSVTATQIAWLVQQKLDWNYLLDSANRHGLTQLLYRHLSSVRPAAAPKEIASKLKDEFLTNSRWAFFHTRELLRTIKVLENNGISAVGFKGPILSLAAYGDVALRQAGDLDILIEKRDLRRATALLDSEGYAIDPQLTAAQLSSHLRFDCEISLVHQESGCVVDLHWGLAPKRFHFALNPGDFFQRLQTITLGNHTLRTFSNEDLVVFLCMHGAKHLWVRLEWISSLAELIRNSEGINWVTVVENARRSHSLRRLLLGLMLAKDLRPDIQIPEQVFTAVPNSESLQRCAEGVRERIFQIRAPDKIEAFLFNLEVMDHKRNAIAGLFLFVLVPRISDWQGAPLPDALYPLYYLLRPLRLAAQFISALGKWIRSRKRFLMKSSPLP